MPRTPSPASEPGAAPRLTAGQRLLLRLPSLQRDRQPAHRSSTAAPPAASPKPGSPKPGNPKAGSPKAGNPKTATAKAATAETGPSAAPKAATSKAGGANGTKTDGTKTNGTKANGTDADADAATPAPAPLGARLRDSLLKPAPAPKRTATGKAPTKQDPYPDKTSAELKRWMKYLDDQERLYTLILAPLAAAISVGGAFYALHANPPVGAKLHVAPTEIVTFGVVSGLLSLAVLAGGLTRRRSFAVFALFFVGFGISQLMSFAVLPFWGVAIWFFWRSSKMQRALTSRGDHPRQQRSRAAGAGRPGAGGAARGRRTKAPEPTGPAPNKRYTPPKPREDADR